MEIYFSPEIMTPHFQVLNVVDSKERAVGNVAFLFAEKKNVRIRHSGGRRCGSRL